MNSKLCKKLRKTARMMAGAYGDGQPVVERELVEIEKNRKTTMVPKRNIDGTMITPMQFDTIDIALGTHVQLQTTVRGIYRRLKKVAKFGTPKTTLQTA